MFQVCLLEANNLCFAGKRRVFVSSLRILVALLVCVSVLFVFFLFFTNLHAFLFVFGLDGKMATS